MSYVPFVLFNSTHLAVLALILVCCILIARTPRQAQPLVQRGVGYTLLFLAIVKPFIFVLIYDEPLAHSLPLDLCRVAEFLCAYMLLAPSYRAFELAYFLAAAGSVSALLTPDLPFGFPEPRFLLFFLSHGLAVLAVVFAVFRLKFHPTLRSVGITILFLGLYTIFIAGVNLLLNANYLFLMAKPEGASIMDFLGPWPIYVGWLIGLAILLCLICYSPFAIAARLRR